MNVSDLKLPAPIASSIRQLKRGHWSEIAYQSRDFGGMVWYWHLGSQEQNIIKEAEKNGLIFLAQKRIAEYEYRLMARTSLEWERGERGG